MGFRDTGYLPFHFRGYRILSILLPGIWDTVFSIFITFRNMGIFWKKIIMVIFVSLFGILACLFQGIWDVWHPTIQTSYAIGTY